VTEDPGSGTRWKGGWRDAEMGAPPCHRISPAGRQPPDIEGVRGCWSGPLVGGGAVVRRGGAGATGSWRVTGRVLEEEASGVAGEAGGQWSKR
jgi:hypothetical protein